MQVELLHNSPLWVASKAIRKCWASEGKSDTFINDRPASINRDGIVVCGTKDRELIERVGNKFKHASTLEHLCLCVEIDDDSTAQKFKENSFSTVTGKNGSWTISTNVRALQDINLTIEAKHAMVPPEYVYLF
jgi:thymidylate synthase (FAD)